MLEETPDMNTALKQEYVVRHELLKMPTGGYLCGKDVFQRRKEQVRGKDRETQKTHLLCLACLKEQGRYGKGSPMMLLTRAGFQKKRRKEEHKISNSEAMPCSQ